MQATRNGAGSNGRADEPLGPGTMSPPHADNGKDAKGRFTKGNKGGPGNPFARRVAELRKLLLETVTEDDLREAMRQLVTKAREGDVAAIKLLLQYTVGKPAQTVEPDRMDLEELELYQEESKPERATEALRGFPADMACELLRIALPCVAKSRADLILAGLKAQLGEDQIATEEHRCTQMTEGEKEEAARAEEGLPRGGDWPEGVLERLLAEQQGPSTNGGKRSGRQPGSAGGSCSGGCGPSPGAPGGG